MLPAVFPSGVYEDSFAERPEADGSKHGEIREEQGGKDGCAVDDVFKQVLSPLLFPNLAVLAAIGLWTLRKGNPSNT